MTDKLTIIGAGLAGSEAAWQAARLGVQVDLWEMRPVRMTEAHLTPQCAELVCSNSLGSESDHSASRILKDELQALDCKLLELARASKVPAGASLAVDRAEFANRVTELLEAEPNVTLKRGEMTALPEGVCIVATGPLTSPALSAELGALLGGDSLYFYDAISPIVSTDSLDLDKMYFANRYDKGDTADFLNIPLTEAQYEELMDDLLAGDVVLPHNFEKEKYFEGCMPIEAIVARGRRTLAFGPMKPVGLDDPKTGRRPHAVIQLRAENRDRTAYNLVGFQTKLKYGEQLRIFRKLPGLENAEFLRLGSMHRNTYIDSPRHLRPTLQLRKAERVHIAGQLTGTEGYLESIATGWLAGQNAARQIRGHAPLELPREMILGSLLQKICDEDTKKFQPTNVNMGLFPPLVPPIRKDKKKRNEAHSLRSQSRLEQWKPNYSSI